MRFVIAAVVLLVAARAFAEDPCARFSDEKRERLCYQTVISFIIGGGGPICICGHDDIAELRHRLVPLDRVVERARARATARR